MKKEFIQGDMKGITLIELLVSAFLFAVLSAAAYLSLDIGRRASRVGGVEIELQQGARKAMTEMSKELRETDSGAVTLFQYTDPQNSEVHQAIAFASARGDSSASVEGICQDSVANNACFHVDVSGNPRWRSLVVYAPYQTSDGRRELRRYVSFNSAYGSGLYFPFSFLEITSTQIRLRSVGGVNFSFNRDGTTNGIAPRVLTENIATEDADNDNALDSAENDGSASLPFDNADGTLDRGADFSLNGRVLTVSLFLRKRDVPYASADRFVVSTLKSSIEMRN